MGRSMSSGGFRSSSFKSSSFKSSTPFKASPPKMDAKPATPAKTVVINKTYKSGDVYHGSGSSTDGLFTGMMLGHMMSDNRPAQAPIIINGGAAAPAQTPTAQTMVPAQPLPEMRPAESEGLGFFGWCFVLLVIGGVCWGVHRHFTKA